MSKYDLVYLGQKATELGFVCDTLEKVYRLAEILEYINTEPLLKNSLALKGGTAINLTMFNLPRLSVDIDLDYLVTDSRAEMLSNRERINTKIEQFMAMQGYTKSPKTKTHTAWIPGYTVISMLQVTETISMLKSTTPLEHIFFRQRSVPS